MTEKSKMTAQGKVPWASANKTANLLIERIKPFCERVEIAGSIRRGAPWVRDIEIVAIPKPAVNLFGEKDYNPREIYAALEGDVLNPPTMEEDVLNPPTMDKKGEFYARFKFFGIYVDLFITTPEKWGCIFLIRTGSADFSRRLMTKKWQGGYLPDDLYFSRGRLWSFNEGDAFYTPEEKDVFRIIGIEYVDPEQRY